MERLRSINGDRPHRLHRRRTWTWRKPSSHRISSGDKLARMVHATGHNGNETQARRPRKLFRDAFKALIYRGAADGCFIKRNDISTAPRCTTCSGRTVSLVPITVVISDQKDAPMRRLPGEKQRLSWGWG